MPVMDTMRREHAHTLLDRLIGARGRVSLGEVTRAMIRADRRFQRRRAEPALRLDACLRPATVARLLHARGYRKVGLDGHGRFAEPLYARPANDTCSPRSGNPCPAAAAGDAVPPSASSPAPPFRSATPASGADGAGGGAPFAAAGLCGARA